MESTSITVRTVKGRIVEVYDIPFNPNFESKILLRYQNKLIDCINSAEIPSDSYSLLAFIHFISKVDFEEIVKEYELTSIPNYRFPIN